MPPCRFRYSTQFRIVPHNHGPRSIRTDFRMATRVVSTAHIVSIASDVSTASVVSTTPASRECRPCVACCIHLPISAGHVGPGSKPAGIKCPHLCSAGCRTYARRLEFCVDFSCAWLKDENWPTSWRPDSSGLLCLREEVDNGSVAALVYELRHGSLHTPLAVEILDELQLAVDVIVVVDFHSQRRRLWIPRSETEDERTSEAAQRDRLVRRAV